MKVVLSDSGPGTRQSVVSLRLRALLFIQLRAFSLDMTFLSAAPAFNLGSYSLLIVPYIGYGTVFLACHLLNQGFQFC